MPKGCLRCCLVICLLLLTHVCFSQNVRRFKGRVVLFDGSKALNNISVRLVDQGRGTTGTDGQFIIPINNNVSTITLELVDSDQSILYPPGGSVAVPRDSSIAIVFIVGDSPKDILTRAVARSNNEIKNGLLQLGVKQDGIEQSLVAFRDEIQKMTNIKLEDLKDQIDLDRRRKEFYPQLAAAINNYTNEAKDLKDAFKFTARHAFDDPQAMQVLIDAVNSYNEAFEDINRKHSGYEKMVADLWESEAKATEVREWFNYALGELHSANIFTLNLKIRDINEYNRGEIKGGRKKDFKDTIMREIEASQLQLERRLQELDNRAQILLSRLAM